MFNHVPTDEHNPKPRLRLWDAHGQAIVVKRSLLRPGFIALLNRPNQKAVFLDRADAEALRDYLNTFLEESS